MSQSQFHATFTLYSNTGGQMSKATPRGAVANEGPSLIIAYSQCIAHGYDLAYGMDQQKAAVLSGYWPLIRYNPDRLQEGKNPLELDSKPPSLPLEKYIYHEMRYKTLVHTNPEAAKQLLKLAQEDVLRRWQLYEHWAAMPVKGISKEEVKR